MAEKTPAVPRAAARPYLPMPRRSRGDGPLLLPARHLLSVAAALAAVTIHPPRVPVWSNVDARPHADPDEIRDLLVQQVLQPVQWEQTIRNLLAAGFDKFYEIGPGRVLAGLLKRVQRRIECVNVAC